MELLREQFPPNDFALLGLIILLPLIGAVVNGIFGKRLGKEAVRLAALATVGGSFVLSLVAFFMVLTTPDPQQGPARLVWEAWEWFRVTGRARQDVPIDIAFSLDALSGAMLLVVTGVGWLIHLYSTGYMAKDSGYHRYFAYLNLFIFSMLVLILGDNMAVLFIGWEGVGLCSYLLIGFWFEDEEKASAGKKAFITNRIGDFGLLVAMAILIYHAGTLEWAKLERGAGGLATTVTLWPPGGMSLQQTSLVNLPFGLQLVDALTPDEHIRASVVTLVALFLFLGCVGKSAQIPLYVWLPDAMAGPTPVSALIHAATMVTAGVYLVARCSFLFVLSPAAMAVVAGVGAVTALLAASIAFAQNDLKKVLAYSTVSQLGFMFVGAGVGAFSAGIFHVITHAFFKGCLFLCAGAVIHAMHAHRHGDKSQDMRYMGGLGKYMPITRATFLVSCFAIAGAPPLSGFWSKDEILYKTFTNEIKPLGDVFWTPPAWYGQLVYSIALVAAIGTAFYMFRAYFLTFEGEFRGWGSGAKGKYRKIKTPPHEAPRVMTVPLIILAALAAIAGFINLEPFHLTPFEHFLAPVFATAKKQVVAAEGAESLLWPLVGAGVVAFAIGAGASYWCYMMQRGEPARRFVQTFPRLHRLVENKWKVDELYRATVIGMFDAMGETAANFDKLFIDFPIARLTSGIASFFGRILSALQTGRVQVYAASMVIGTAALGWFLLSPHAEARVDDSRLEDSGLAVLSAAPGHGYKYRWRVAGENANGDFGKQSTFELALRPCEQKTIVLEVQNVLGQIDEDEITHCRFRDGQRTCCVPAAELPPEPPPAPDASGRGDPRQMMDRLRDMQRKGIVPTPGGPPGAPPGGPPGARIPPADRRPPQ